MSLWDKAETVDATEKFVITWQRPAYDRIDTYQLQTPQVPWLENSHGIFLHELAFPLTIHFFEKA